MTEATEQHTVESTLGQEFWIQPEGSLRDEYNLIFNQVAQVLREEARERNSTAIDFMIIERMAYMYAKLRQREADTGDLALTDRSRRELNKDWVELATSMKKLWVAEDKDGAAEALLKKVDKAIFEGLKDLPDGVRMTAQQSLAGALQSNGL